MPTGPSSTELSPRPTREPAWWRPVRDVGHLLRFRSAALRRRATYRWSLVLLVVTLGAAIVPALVPPDDERRLELGVLLPTAMAGILLISIVSAIASGGGRELVAREHAVAFPISSTTDHLGALLLAPLNISWLIQAWVLLGTTAYVVGPGSLVAALPVMVLWMAFATALAQVVAWSVETVRRRRHGVVVMRVALAALGVGALAVQLSGSTVNLLDRVPTQWVLIGGLQGDIGWRWGQTVLVMVGLLLLAVVAGALPARWASRHLPHDELRAEVETRTPRRMPSSDFAALVRLDRASVWRAVPMRRGMTVLAVGPGLVAVLGNLPWESVVILPGLVVSGGALLFGVNAWCLDGRGLLWRENLPVGPGLVFAARALVTAEFLGFAALVTILLAALRAGVPTAGELTALVCTLVVVTVQVVGGAMRWSQQRPFSVDLRSARATPAPPVMMVSYSARLALSTTFTGLLFSMLARYADPAVSLLAAVICLAWSGTRLLRSGRRWVDPFARARVVTVVSA